MSVRLKIGDFRVGTLGSRAAARVLLSQRRSELERLQFFHSVRGPWRGDGTEPPNVPRAYPWFEGEGGKLIRVVYVPHVWLSRGELVPSCPECRTPYRKDTDYTNYPLVGYRADCMEKHIPDFISSRSDRVW
jgi:hypothetical protein